MNREMAKRNEVLAVLPDGRQVTTDDIDHWTGSRTRFCVTAFALFAVIVGLGFLEMVLA